MPTDNIHSEDKVWDRDLFTKPNGKPFLFYVIFGSDISKLQVSKSKHNIDEMPNELEITAFSKDDPNQKLAIESYYANYFGTILKDKNQDLYTKITQCQTIVVVSGQFEDTPSLNYLKNTIGIVQALIEACAIAVLDPQILQWFTPEEWTSDYFLSKKPNPFNNVCILKSIDKNNIWLHTRGMRKFGRPDISFPYITIDDEHSIITIINRFIEAFAKGMFPDAEASIKMNGLRKTFTGCLKGDYDNLDFNNYYLEFKSNTILSR